MCKHAKEILATEGGLRTCTVSSANSKVEIDSESHTFPAIYMYLDNGLVVVPYINHGTK